MNSSSLLSRAFARFVSLFFSSSLDSSSKATMARFDTYRDSGPDYV